MSPLSRLLRRSLGRDKGKDDKKIPLPVPEPQVDQQAIDDFLALAPNASMTEKLRAFRRCNSTVSGLKPDSPQKNSVDDSCLPILCGTAHGAMPTNLADDTDDTRSPYIRMVQNPSPDNVPDLDDIFAYLLTGSARTNHPAGISSFLFAFACLISLCISYPDLEDTNYNKAKGLLDLAPLYGLADEDTKDIRDYDKGLGLLLPDAYSEAEERVIFLPRAVSVLLVLFNRNHNHIARCLYKENETGRWVDPADFEDDESALEAQDDAIFALARRINCGLFRKIVVNDFLKGLLGLESHEGNPAIDLFKDIKPEELGSHPISVEFSLLYNWQAMSSEADVNYIESVLSEQLGVDPEDDEIDSEPLEEFWRSLGSSAVANKGLRACAGLERNDETSRFNDEELANILIDATESIAPASQARSIPASMRLFELASMKQARMWGVCSFNEFRRLLGLPAYTDFNQWCGIPEIANAARQGYGNIDRLELYPGLRGEKALSSPGFCLGETMTQGLIFDIVNLVRSDPEFSEGFTREALTDWGYEELLPNPNNGGLGAFLPKLLLRNLPNNYPYNNIYGLFPLTVPTKTRENLPTLGPTGREYQSDRPGSILVETLRHLDPILAILGDPETYPSPFAGDVRKVTGGYGHLLNFDGTQANDDHHFLMLKCVIPDSGALGRFGQFYRAKTEELIKRQSNRIDDMRCQLDLIPDVINPVIATWAAEQLCGVPLNTVSGYTEKEIYNMLLDLDEYMFGNEEPQDRHALFTRALEAAKKLTDIILHNMELADADPSAQSTSDQAAELLLELFVGEAPEHSSAEGFLARLAASELDKKELSANVLQFAVITSIKFARICAGAVRFYLNDRRAEERQELHDLATQGPEVNGTVMGYIRESYRLNPQIDVLTRHAARDTVLNAEGGSSLSLSKGQRIIFDVDAARENEPGDIDPERYTNVYHGPGLFKFLDEQFVQMTMPEVFKAIFRLDGIKLERGAGARSALISYKNPKPASKGKKVKRPLRPTSAIRYVCDVILVAIAVVILCSTILGIGRFVTRRTCGRPRHYRPWEVYTLLPGPDNQTLPFINTLSHPSPRLVSFVDADVRDMRFRVLIDGSLKKVSSNFDLALGTDCGVDADKCVNGGWSRVRVFVPPGKHTVTVEWIGKDFVPGTNVIDWGTERRRRIMWKQELC